MRRALLVYSNENKWAFYMNGQKHLLKLVEANLSYACTLLTAEINHQEITVRAKDDYEIFGLTRLSFSGEHVIVWDDK